MQCQVKTGKGARKQICQNEVGVGDFASGYIVNGQPILPPLMTNEKRMEIRICRLEALVKSQPNILNQAPPPITPMEHKSTNTDPAVVMGRIHQRLTRSKTEIHDYISNQIIQFEPPGNTPVLVISKQILEETPRLPLQRAMVKITPLMVGTQISSSIARLEAPNQSNIPIPASREMLSQRSNTCLDLNRLHPQLWQNKRAETTVGRKAPSNTIPTADPKYKKPVPKMRFQSRIPVRQKVQEPQQDMDSVHASCSSSGLPKKEESASERRRNYDQKVAVKRNNMAKKREESTAKQNRAAKEKNLNQPKSIRTPVSVHSRINLATSDLQEQRDCFQSLVARQVAEHQRLQDEFEKEQQSLIDKMIGDLSSFTSETSTDGSSQDVVTPNPDSSTTTTDDSSSQF